MAYDKIKPNMHGTGGGRWTKREEAKRAANKARRTDDSREAEGSIEEASDDGAQPAASDAGRGPKANP